MIRKPTYLSPSALKCWENDPSTYYMRYLAPSKPPKEPQTRPMAAGSAFDAYVKSYLHGHLFGSSHAHAAKYQLNALIEAQVEPHNRDWAIGVGSYLFRVYEKNGCLADLMTMLAKSAIEPRFEFDVKGTIQTPHGAEREGMTKLASGVPLLGKPDVFMTTEEGYHVVHDFKVNGYCSAYNTSPLAGYVRIRPGGSGHKDCMPMMYRGIMIDGSCYFEQRNAEWADQLATYGWLLGEPIGGEFSVSVDQLVCNHGSRDGTLFPEVRIAYHRSRVSENMQYDLLNRYMTLWARIIEEPFYFFRDKSLEDSKLVCNLLDKQAVSLYGDLTREDIALLEMCR